jgi:hypothetical protein
MATCWNCEKPFQKMYGQQHYCKRPECVQDREGRKLKQHHDYSDAVKKKNREHRRQCTGNGCRNKTSNYFGICDECRTKIIDTINTDFLEVAI